MRGDTSCRWFNRLRKQMENQNSGFSLFHEHETVGVIIILAIMIMSFLVLRINAEPTVGKIPVRTIGVTEMPVQGNHREVK